MLVWEFIMALPVTVVVCHPFVACVLNVGNVLIMIYVEPVTAIVQTFMRLNILFDGSVTIKTVPRPTAVPLVKAAAAAAVRMKVTTEKITTSMLWQ
jgi:hypothetical protein|tara:strand:- start:108 stop:395 length:288 start_codon:yes stop_codon:yes gene_type:complete